MFFVLNVQIEELEAHEPMLEASIPKYGRQMYTNVVNSRTKCRFEHLTSLVCYIILLTLLLVQELELT